MLGMIGWAVLLVAFVAWDLFARRRYGMGIETLFRPLTAAAPGRWLLFALWLWVGWHVFVRGLRLPAG